MNEQFTPAEAEAIERLEKGIEWRTVLPVVGAGVSHQGAQLPLWNSLLAKAIEWTHGQDDLPLSQERLERLKALSIDSPTPSCYETWVETVFCRNQGDIHWETPEYREWLQEVFGSPTVVNRRIYEALGAMDSRIVATTNYDGLLKDELMPKGQVVTWGDDDAIRSLIREEQGILHLHGFYGDPESVILSASDYTRVTERDMASDVARTLTSGQILLFIGVSPEAATDRHLHKMLKLGLGKNRGRQEPRAHVLLHRGTLTTRQITILSSVGIEPVRFGDTYEDLAPFLERLSRRRSDYTNAIHLLGLDQRVGEELSDSRWAPQQCIGRVKTSLRFMGLRSSKWVGVEDGTFTALDEALEFLDDVGSELVRFLILNPESDAYERLRRRRTELSSDHLQRLAELEQKHRSLQIKCVDFISAFRFTAVNDREIGLALYPTTQEEFRETDRGWSVRHHNLVTDRPWSLGGSLVFMFDEHFRAAQSLRDVKPELFS